MGLPHTRVISCIGKGYWMFEELWGRYAPVMARELVRVTGCSRNFGVATLQSWPARHFCALFLSNRNLTKMTRRHVPKALLQIGLKLPSLSRQHMDSSPGEWGISQANYFLSYILREEIGGKKYQEMGGKKQPDFVCYAYDGIAVGVPPQNLVDFCPPFLDIFCPLFLLSIYS